MEGGTEGPDLVRPLGFSCESTRRSSGKRLTNLRRISVQEIRESIATGKVIEDYPDDKYGPSCLILGLAAVGRAIHVQCRYPDRTLVKIITVYEPDPNQWIGYEHRRG